MENISIVRVSSISVGSHLSIFHNTVLRGLAHQSSIIANYIFIFLLFFKTKMSPSPFCGPRTLDTMLGQTLGGL